MLKTTGMNMTDLIVNLNETREEDPRILVMPYLTYKIGKSNLQFYCHMTAVENVGKFTGKHAMYHTDITGCFQFI